jgi:hypothetical protein
MKHGLTIKTEGHEDTALIIRALSVLSTYRDLAFDQRGDDVLAGISKISYSRKEDAWVQVTWRDGVYGRKAGHIFAKAWEYVTWGAGTEHFDKDGNEFESDGFYRTPEEEAQDAKEWAEIDAEFKAKEQAQQQARS